MNEAMRVEVPPLRNGAEVATKSNIPERVSRELSHAKDVASNAAHGLEARVQAHPWASAGLLFGGGLVVGAVLYRVIFPPPTASQVVGATLKRAALDAQHTLANGLTAARRFVE